MALVVKNPPASAGDAGLIPEPGRSPGEENDNPLQYFCLGNPMDRGVCQAIVHRITKSWIQLKRFSTHCHWIWRRQWQPTPVLLPWQSHGWRSLVVCSPWGRYESDTTEWLHFHFSLSCIGEGNDNPLQYFCLENPRDGGAWWTAVCGVAQSRTWLKQLIHSCCHWIKSMVILQLLLQSVFAGAM